MSASLLAKRRSSRSAVQEVPKVLVRRWLRSLCGWPSRALMWQRRPLEASVEGLHQRFAVAWSGQMGGESHGCHVSCWFLPLRGQNSIFGIFWKGAHEQNIFSPKGKHEENIYSPSWGWLFHFSIPQPQSETIELPRNSTYPMLKKEKATCLPTKMFHVLGKGKTWHYNGLLVSSRRQQDHQSL